MLIGPGLRGAPLAAAFGLVVVAVAACSSSTVVPTAPPDTGRPAVVTDAPIAPTPWPNGTTGKYGLRIDPRLAGQLPSSVGGNPLVEDTFAEIDAMGESQYGASFDAMYIAQVGEPTDLNWVQATVATVKGGAIGDEFYASWRDAWYKLVCTQAGGLASSSRETINDWQVDIGLCSGGARAYVLELDNGVLLSLVDVGPRQLGRELIQALN